LTPDTSPPWRARAGTPSFKSPPGRELDRDFWRRQSRHHRGGCDAVAGAFAADDTVLVQNEVSAVPAIIRTAKARGMRVVFNRPHDARGGRVPFGFGGSLCPERSRGEALTGEVELAKVRRVLQARFPHAVVVLTLGAQGAVYFDAQALLQQPAERVEAVDTTAAGDTFVGFFLAEMIRTNDPPKALRLACRAAAVCVTRPGAADSIPRRQELVASEVPHE